MKNYKIEKPSKILHTDNNKTFHENSDIAFKFKDTGSSIIARLVKIKKHSIIITDIEIDKRIKLNAIIKVKLKDIEENSCNYVYVD